MNAPGHDTPQRYKQGCRDDGCGCRAAIAAVERRRYRLKAYGQWQDPYTDAGPAREHVRALQAARIGWKQVAALAGVPDATVSRLLYGKAGPPSARIRTGTARALLAVRLPGLDALPAAARTGSAGTARRLQALIAQGRTITALAGRLGMERPYLGRVAAGKVPAVTAGTARSVRDLYEDWWDQPAPEGTPREKRAASLARGYAQARGWVTGGWWDDTPGPHWIDDPQARPAPGWRSRVVS